MKKNSKDESAVNKKDLRLLGNKLERKINASVNQTEEKLKREIKGSAEETTNKLRGEIKTSAEDVTNKLRSEIKVSAEDVEKKLRGEIKASGDEIVRRLEDTIIGVKDILLTTMDSFAKDIETNREDRDLAIHQTVEIRRQVNDHEKRIKNLEKFQRAG
ncbi:MAG: hypothetical protein C4584_00450 [Armatimonadetes bacterium]|nr:MAG: hypothetical protein C4584_00450 [Armatimonadota bacterium]